MKMFLKKMLLRLAVASVLTVLTFTSLSASDSPYVARDTDSNVGLLREILNPQGVACEPFEAVFNPETGIILFYDMDGELKSWYRENQTEDTFRELVSANRASEERIAEYLETGIMSYRNITINDHKTRNFYEYDNYGNVTVTSWDDLMETFYEHDENGNVREVTLSRAEIHDKREQAFSRHWNESSRTTMCVVPLSFFGMI